MIYLVLAFTLLNVCFYLFLTICWSKVPKISSTSTARSFSVIIPVRNEEETIEKVLACLEYQQYDKDKYEVLVVNDFSDDSTMDVLSKCLDQFEMNLRVISLENHKESGKKYALTRGAEEAKNDFIITTDADCQMSPNWLSSYASLSADHKFIAGPVALKGQGFWAELQQAEFSGLIGFGAVTLNNNNPSMCSGANMGFSKDAFFEVGGYSDNIQIPSGDDEFLLFSIQDRYPKSAAFLKNQSSIVITPVHKTLRGFANQRIRWTSKWKHNKNPKLRMMAVLFFFDYFFLIASAFYTLMGSFSVVILSAVLAIRWLVQVCYVSPVHKFLGLRSAGLQLLVIQIIYPFHILIMGLNSIFGGYTWKGRKY